MRSRRTRTELQRPPSSRPVAARACPPPPPPAITRPFPPPVFSTRPSPPQLPSATGQESNVLQLSPPSCSASPFLLHKITEAEERGGKGRSRAPRLPTQLSYSTITRRAQLAAPLLLHPIGWPRSGPVPMAVHPQRVEL